MLTFQVSVHGWRDGQPDRLGVTFDAALSALETLPRMFIEPDGSFVWTGVSNGQRWQVDGNLLDRGDLLAYVELKGHCETAEFNQLLATLGWPNEQLAFQLSQRGIFLDESAFREAAATERGAI